MPGSTTLPGIFFAAADFYGDFTQKRSLNLHRLAIITIFQMNQTAIGSYIARKRKEQNLTQEQLAQQLGVSNKTISKWENGVSHS